MGTAEEKAREAMEMGEAAILVVGVVVVVERQVAAAVMAAEATGRALGVGNS